MLGRLKNSSYEQKKEIMLNLISFRNLYNEYCYLNGEGISMPISKDILIYDLADLRELAKVADKPIIIESLREPGPDDIVRTLNYRAYFHFNGVIFNSFCKIQEVIR